MERLNKKRINLPSSPNLTEEQIKTFAGSIKEEARK